MKQTALRLSLLLSALSQSSLAYKWPNPQIDELDHNLFDQIGYNANFIFDGGAPTCDHFFGGDRFGRQNAAEVRSLTLLKYFF